MESSTSSADIEVAYRFTRNKAINARAIAESGFLATAKCVNQYDCLLALEDIASLEFKHQKVRDEMLHASGKASAHATRVCNTLHSKQHSTNLIPQSFVYLSVIDNTATICSSVVVNVPWHDGALSVVR